SAEQSHARRCRCTPTAKSRAHGAWKLSQLASICSSAKAKKQILRTASRGSRPLIDRKSTRLNSSHLGISYAVFCLKKKKKHNKEGGFEVHKRGVIDEGIDKRHAMVGDHTPAQLQGSRSSARLARPPSQSPQYVLPV